jgi:hypothetical protein
MGPMPFGVNGGMSGAPWMGPLDLHRRHRGGAVSGRTAGPAIASEAPTEAAGELFEAKHSWPSDGYLWVSIGHRSGGPTKRAYAFVQPAREKRINGLPSGEARNFSERWQLLIFNQPLEGGITTGPPSHAPFAH